MLCDVSFNFCTVACKLLFSFSIETWRRLSGRRSPNPIALSLSINTVGERGRLRVEFHDSDAESTKVVNPTPDQVNQSKPPLEAFEVMVWFLCKAMLMLTIVVVVECDVMIGASWYEQMYAIA